MFEGFEGGGDRQSRKRFAVSSGASMAIGLLMILALIAVASRPREKKKTKPPPVKVSFQKPVKRKPPPPPAPKPKPRPRRAAARAAAKPAGPTPAPTQRPQGALPEADASAFQAGAFAGIAWGDEAGAGLGGGALPSKRKAASPPAQPRLRGVSARPVEEAERMTPPRPDPGNRPPVYPDAMRKKGVEALVILRILIDEDGRVADIDVVQGDEPFVAAALDVVKAYRYEPALLDGRPAAVHRLLRVPFRLRT